jgi:hypothetical protein
MIKWEINFLSRVQKTVNCLTVNAEDKFESKAYLILNHKCLITSNSQLIHCKRSNIEHMKLSSSHSLSVLGLTLLNEEFNVTFFIKSFEHS